MAAKKIVVGVPITAQVSVQGACVFTFVLVSVCARFCAEGAIDELRRGIVPKEEEKHIAVRSLLLRVCVHTIHA